MDLLHNFKICTGVSFFYADGSRYLPFGTTVYALPAQPAERIEETLETLEKAPFNKLRLCVFPKYFDFNREEPELFPFERGEGERKWNVRRPCPAFWDRLDGILSRLNDAGIEADLILFHPYDCCGFAELSVEEAKTYLEYAVHCMCRMTPEEFEHMKEYMTQPVLHYEDEVFLTYFGDACTISGMLDLPEDGKYRIDVIDVWEMTRETVMEEAGGAVQVPLPGKPK